MPGRRGDPARVPAHDLDDHHAVVALRGGVDAVDGLGRDGHRGVEPDRLVRAPDVVVDRLGDGHDPDARLGDLARGVQRAVAADADERLDALRLQRRQDGVEAAVVGVRVVAGGAEERAADGQLVADVLAGERQAEPVDDAPPPVAEADDRVPVLALAALDDGADRGVQAGDVAATREQTDSHAGTP